MSDSLSPTVHGSLSSFSNGPSVIEDHILHITPLMSSTTSCVKSRCSSLASLSRSDHRGEAWQVSYATHEACSL